MATAADVKAMSTPTLVDELERLVRRVKDRDDKYYKRMRFPMGHAHPSQFWPICSEAYKLSWANRILYFRASDWVHLFFLSFSAAIAGHLGCIYRWPGNYWMRQEWKRWPYILMLGFFVGWCQRSSLVELRMYGLEENAQEVEKYGPLFPDEIELAAKRKLKYEQEYIRVRENLMNFKEVSERVDRPISFWDDRSAPGMSGYFADQEAKLKHARQQAGIVAERNQQA